MTGKSLNRAVVTELLRSAVDEAATMPTADVQQIKVLIDSGELRVALETLCTQAYEYDVELSQDQREALRGLGEALDVPVRYLLGDPWADPPGGTA